MHRIQTADGGHDNLLPGRWLANTTILGMGINFACGHGRTEDEAVEDLIAKFTAKLHQFPRERVR
jgi:hypothetical protein